MFVNIFLASFGLATFGTTSVYIELISYNKNDIIRARTDAEKDKLLLSGVTVVEFPAGVVVLLAAEVVVGVTVLVVLVSPAVLEAVFWVTKVLFRLNCPIS